MPKRDTRREHNMRLQGIVECEDCGRLCEAPKPGSGLLWLGWCMVCAFDKHTHEEKRERAYAAREAALYGGSSI